LVVFHLNEFIGCLALNPLRTPDRRAERRYRGKGALKLTFDDPSRQEISGRLVDYSQSAFRAVHSCPALHTGQVVAFRHAVDAGETRVM
jgi:hypothetical protein